MKIIVGLSFFSILLMAVVAWLSWQYRVMRRKKDLSIINRMQEQDRLQKELETVRTERQVMERIIRSKVICLIFDADNNQSAL